MTNPDSDKIPAHDVAISFLSADEAIAANLKNLLAGLNVFFFPSKQEELAGTDGLESMREPFLRARVAVVFYREGWGKTKWTRIEETAIKERCLESGWQSLTFVVLDRNSQLPKWLPTTHVRFNLEDYGIDQLAGAIKARVQEQGGTIRKLSAMDHAAQVHRKAELDQLQNTLFHDARWITETVHPLVESVMNQISDTATQIRTKTGMDIVGLAKRQRCILRSRQVSINVGWRQTYTNVLDEKTGIISAEFNCPMFYPEERMMQFYEPTELRRLHYILALSESQDLRWIEINQRSLQLTSPELADQIVKQFVGLLDRVRLGKVQLAG